MGSLGQVALEGLNEEAGARVVLLYKLLYLHF